MTQAPRHAERTERRQREKTAYSGADVMDREFWLDGFNFFYYWENTKGLLRPDSGFDIVRAIDRSLRILGRFLGSKCRHTLVFLDGGLSRSETRAGDVRVRYCGPGKKADDRMLADLAELGDYAKMVTAVSNDRELRANLKTYGASCLGGGEYLSLLKGKAGRGAPAAARNGKGGRNASSSSGGRVDEAAILREKCRTLSPSEISAWLECFGGDVQG